MLSAPTSSAFFSRFANLQILLFWNWINDIYIYIYILASMFWFAGWRAVCAAKRTHAPREMWDLLKMWDFEFWLDFLVRRFSHRAVFASQNVALLNIKHDDKFNWLGFNYKTQIPYLAPNDPNPTWVRPNPTHGLHAIQWIKTCSLIYIMIDMIPV